ncbi:MAG: HEAT repeat domain-containing protein [Kiritimatiellae bacterium]|nr:HEAT repeat domain-containing protein [Kiritimatiellia bacterium]
MNAMKTWLIIGLLAATGITGWSKTAGLWKDSKSYITDGMLKTLQDAGWKTVILEGKDLADEAKLVGVDVIFLPGGWNGYNFANFNARRNLVKFVAGGKGILAGAFRSGYVRTANRPLFPQVGATYNRVNGPYLCASGDSDLAKAIDQPFCPGGWDHLVVKVGPLGKVFAVSGNDPVGVYGDVYGGRYVVFGAFLGMDAKTEAMQGTARQVLLKSMEWLAGAPKLSEADKAQQQAQADLDFLRREKIWDWTLNERGPDRSPGILPQIRIALAIPLESRQYTLQYMSQYLSGKQLEKCQAMESELKKAVQTLDSNFKKAGADMTARIGKMTLAELTAENPFLSLSNVVKLIEATPGKTDEEKKVIKAALVGEYAPKMVGLYLHGDTFTGQFLAAARLKELVGRSDQVIAELRPAVNSVKAAQCSEKRKQDLTAIPGLIEACVSPDADTRREATLELGRIGDPKAAPALIKALKDSDEKVRINAILGLGWMQSKEAIPALMGVAEGDDLLMRRRAVQALGQIGDARAVPVLIANLDNKDYFVVENAILALGWLKAKAAVPRLLKIVTGVANPDAEQRGLMMATMLALGHIGDSSALPALEALAKTDDFPVSRSTGKKIVNIYSTPQVLGLQGHAELAIREIRAGGRQEMGVRQAEFLAGNDKFYGLTRRFNALAGRSSTPSFKDDPAALWPYLWEAGLTGIHQAWGEQDADPDKYQKLIEAAGDLDLLWIDVLPVDVQPYSATRYTDKRQNGVYKSGAELVLLRYQNVPAFQGFWSEECYPDVKMSVPEFETWLKDRYGADFRKKLGVAAGHDLLGMTGTNYASYQGPLKVEYVQACADKLLAHWRESQEWLSGVRKGCSFTYSISGPGSTMRYPGVASKAGTVIDVNGPESYQAFGRFNAFLMETYKDGEANPVMSEFYNWYTPSPAHEVRGFAQHLMHGECFYSFALHHVFAQASSYDLWSWDVTRWGNLSRIFQKARKTREYLNVPASGANVGLLASELSYVPFYVKEQDNNGGSLPNRWYQNQSALWIALNQSQIPTDIIWTETLSPGKLNRYRVLVLSDAKIITESQAKALRDWVASGGILIASGTTALFGPGAEQQKNYQLAELFGVNYRGHAGVDDPARIDTYCWKQAGPTTFKAVSGLDPENFRNHVHREIKPVKSLGTYTVSDKEGTYLPGIVAGMVCEYDLPLGYDKVTPASAEVLAKFVNGDAALTVNKVGKGICYFWTPIYPGLCHVESGWEMQPNDIDFWPNVRELLAAMVKGGLAHGKASLPVDVSGVSKQVEVTVRQQPEHNRMIVHLLNYDAKVDLVKSPHMTVHPPDGQTVKRIFYPDTGTELKFSASQQGVDVIMRDFDVHDMVVIEY